MKTFRAMTDAEKIVHLFSTRATELHRSSIETATELSAERFDQVIGRARDLGFELFELRITPIYEREGWWTATPTQRIAAKACDEATKRNLGEAERNARIYEDFGALDESVRGYRAAIAGARALLLQELPETQISIHSDYVLKRVDRAIEAGKGYVERESSEIL